MARSSRFHLNGYSNNELNKRTRRIPQRTKLGFGAALATMNPCDAWPMIRGSRCQSPACHSPRISMIAVAAFRHQYTFSNCGCTHMNSCRLFCTRTIPPKLGSSSFNHACNCRRTGPCARIASPHSRSGASLRSARHLTSLRL